MPPSAPHVPWVLERLAAEERCLSLRLARCIVNVIALSRGGSAKKMVVVQVVATVEVAHAYDLFAMRT